MNLIRCKKHATYITKVHNIYVIKDIFNTVYERIKTVLDIWWESRNKRQILHMHKYGKWFTSHYKRTTRRLFIKVSLTFFRCLLTHFVKVFFWTASLSSEMNKLKELIIYNYCNHINERWVIIQQGYDLAKLELRKLTVEIDSYQLYRHLTFYGFLLIIAPSNAFVWSGIEQCQFQNSWIYIFHRKPCCFIIESLAISKRFVMDEWRAKFLELAGGKFCEPRMMVTSKLTFLGT